MIHPAIPSLSKQAKRPSVQAKLPYTPRSTEQIHQSRIHFLNAREIKLNKNCITLLFNTKNCVTMHNFDSQTVLLFYLARKTVTMHNFDSLDSSHTII